MNLTDSLVNTNVFVNIGDTSWSHRRKYTVSFQIDLTQSCNVTGLTLTPILDKPAGNCFPKRFQIQISDDAVLQATPCCMTRQRITTPIYILPDD